VPAIRRGSKAANCSPGQIRAAAQMDTSADADTVPFSARPEWSDVQPWYPVRPSAACFVFVAVTLTGH